jgi:hypothetical protein
MRKCLCLSNLHPTLLHISRKCNGQEFDGKTFVADALRLAVRWRHGLYEPPTTPALSGGGKNSTKTGVCMFWSV